MTSGWTNTSSELLRLMPLIYSYTRRIFSTESGEDFEVPSLSYSSVIPSILLFGLFGITYFVLSPLILPFLLVYFCQGYIVYRHQVRLIHDHQISCYLIIYIYFVITIFLLVVGKISKLHFWSL